MARYFLHGALFSGAQLNPILTHLEGSWEALDLPGFGIRSHETNFLIPDQVDFLAQILPEEPVDLFGYSFGGYVALCFALQYPKRVNSILMLNTILHWDENIYQKESSKLDAGFLTAKAPDFYLQLQKLHASDPAIILESTKMILRDILIHQYINPHSLSSIKVPVKILVGAKDNGAGSEASLSLASCIPEMKLEILAEGRHPMESYAPEVLASMVNSYFVK